MTTCPDCQQTWADDGTLGEIVSGKIWCDACMRRVANLHAADHFITADFAAIEKAVLSEAVALPRIEPLLSKEALKFSYLVGKMTGRWRSDIPRTPSLPMHPYRGRMQCKVRIGIPLEKCGQRWRMARRNTGDSFSLASGGLCPSFLGIDPRPFASRAAALKYARKLWSKARVELVSYGLEVTIYQPDFHLIRAVDDRTTRSRGKLRNFSSIYGECNFGLRSQHDDHADAVMGALAQLKPTTPPIVVSDPG